MVSSNRIIHSTYTQSFHNFFFSVIFDSNRFPLDDTNPIKKKDWEWKRTNLNNKIIETSKPSNRLVSGLVWFGLIWLFARGKKIISSILFFFSFQIQEKKQKLLFWDKKKEKKIDPNKTDRLIRLGLRDFFFLDYDFVARRSRRFWNETEKKTEKLFSRIVFGFFFWFKLLLLLLFIRMLENSYEIFSLPPYRS